MGSTPALATRMKMRNLAVEISISCRLVKDHRKVIHLTAICHPPQLSLSHTDLTFSMPRLDASALHKGRGLLQPSGPALRIEPKDGAVIQVANLGGSPLKYAVRFSCCFFNVDASSEGEAIAEAKDGKILHTITVTPNERAIQSHLPFLAKARFVEEHFCVYNLADLSEHKCVLLRLSCGSMHAPGSSSHLFSPSESTSATLRLKRRSCDSIARSQPSGTAASPCCSASKG